MRLNALFAAVAVLFALSAAAHAAEYRETFTLREPLGQTWTDELVHHDLAIPQPKVGAAMLALADAAGNPVPVQVETLEGKPDGVRRARLWLKATLPAGQSVSYTATWNTDGRPAARPGPALALRRGDGRLLVMAGAFELMVPALDKPFEKPVPLKKVPAPILGLRPAGGQAWYGACSLDGAPYVREVQTTVDAAGPLWAQVRLRYVFDQGGQSYDVVLRIVRDEPWVDVTERYRLPPSTGSAADKAAGCRMTAVFRGGRPAEAVWMPWHVGRDGQSQAAYDVHRLVLDERFPPDAPFAALRPRYTQVRDATQVLLVPAAGETGPTVGAIMMCPSDWMRPYDSFPTVRPLASSPADAKAKAPASTGAPAAAQCDAVAIDFPLTEGKRRWALVMAPHGRLDSKAQVQALIRRAADLPLDRILNDWVLTWPRGKVDPAPHLLTTWDRLHLAREDLAAGKETPATKLLMRILASDVPADRRLAELLAGRREAAGLSSASPFTPLPAVGEGVGVRGEAPAVLSVAPILTECYQSAALAPSAWPRGLPAAMIEADLAASGRAPAAGEPSTPADAALALLAYVFTDPNYQVGGAGGWEPGSPAFWDGLYVIPLYAAAMLPDHPHAGRWASAAMAAMRDDLRRAAGPPADAAALAQVLAHMRMAQNGRLEDPFRWPEVRPAVEFLMSLHTPPDPRLGRRDLAPLAAISSPRLGRRDLAPLAAVSSPRLGRRDLAPLAAVSSPRREPRGISDRALSASGAAPGAPTASAWHDAVGALFGLAAAGFREPDPKFAAQCLALYRNYYGDGASGDLAADLAAAEAGSAAPADPALWAGRKWPGFGAVLRSRFGGDRETMVVFRCGPSRGPDEMAFHFFGAGMPLALAWHAGPPLQIQQEPFYNRVSVGESENMDAPAELLAMESTPAADVAVGQMQTAMLRKLPRFPQEITAATAYPRRALLSETRWRRYLALIKHEGGPLEDYLVIRDELVSAEPEAFNLWVLARSVRQEGRLFHFDGQLAADAVAFVASPDVDRIKVEPWSWPRQDESSMIPPGFAAKAEQGGRAEEGGRSPTPLRLLTTSSAGPAAPPATWRVGELQQRLRIRGSPGEDYLVVLYPYRKGSPVPEFEVLSGGKGVRVTLGGVSEDVYLSADPPPEAGGQAVVRRAGQTTIILKSAALPPFAKAVAE